MRAPHRRLPLEPLLDYLRLTSGLPEHRTNAPCACSVGRGGGLDAPRCLSNKSIAALCGVSERMPYRWVDSGGITVFRAEVVADHLGVHPAEIWADYYSLATA